MDSELKSLRIDRNKRSQAEPSRWATRWIIGGVAALRPARRRTVSSTAMLNAATEVEIVRVAAPPQPRSSGGDVILNATGYIVAAHKIQVASKVLGRVAWIGVDKGDKVKEGQIIVRLEDEEYKAQLQQARGRLQALEARLKELETGSRPEEITARRPNSKKRKRTSRTPRSTSIATSGCPPKASSPSRRWMTQRRATIVKSRG